MTQQYTTSNLQPEPRAPLKAPFGAFRALRLLIVAGAGFVAVISVEAAVQKTVVVTWHYEAPEIAEPLFNSTGSRTIPLEMKGACAGIEGVRLQAFQYIEGSSLSTDRNPVRNTAQGMVAYFAHPAATATPRLAITIELGKDDWVGRDTFVIPRLSPEQWTRLPAEAGWVFQRDGMVLPQFWNRVILKCD
jgi:hypothetical protein